MIRGRIKETARLSLLFAIFLLTGLLPASSFACTVFACAKGVDMMAGNNEDWFDKDTFIWFIPAEDGKYGYAGYGFENGHIQGGINEKGLFFDWFAQGGTLAPSLAEKEIYAGELSTAILPECASVQQALTLYEKYNDRNLGYATLLLADSTGDMATLTWDYENNKPRVETANGTHMAIGVGAAAILPMLQDGEWANDEGFAAMAKLASNENTLYSTVCNLNKPSLTLYHLGHFEQGIQFDLLSELQKGRHLYSIPSLFPAHETGTQNQMTPAGMRSAAQNIGCTAIIGILGAAALYCLFMLLRRNRKTILLFAIGAAANFCMLGLALMVNDWAYFIVKFGVEILGVPAMALSYAAGVLAVAQGIATALAWVKKSPPLLARIVLSVSTLLSFVLIWYFTTMGMYIG